MSDFQQQALAMENRAAQLEQKLLRLTTLIKQNQQSGLLVS
jgi:hypothetical protein